MLPFPLSEWHYLVTCIRSDLNTLYEALKYLDAVGLLPPWLTSIWAGYWRQGDCRWGVSEVAQYSWETDFDWCRVQLPSFEETAMQSLSTSPSPVLLHGLIWAPGDHYHQFPSVDQYAIYYPLPPSSLSPQPCNNEALVFSEVLPIVHEYADCQRCQGAEEVMESRDEGEEQMVQTKWQKQIKSNAREAGQCSQGAVGPGKKKSWWTVKDSPFLNTSNTVESFVAPLAAAHWGSATYDMAGWTSEVREKLKDLVIFHDISLGSLVWRCEELHSLGVQVSFLIMLTQIQLVVKCKRYASFTLSY